MFKTIGLKILGISQFVWEFLLPLIKAFLKKEGPVLAAAAFSAVKLISVSMVGFESTVKKEAAFAKIVSDLKSQSIQVGVDVLAGDVYVAIEAAYKKLFVEP